MRKLFCIMLPVILCISGFNTNTTITVKGTIKDETGAPIPNVTVIVKGTNNGTSSDVKGQYSIMVNKEKATLQFSSVGYTLKEEKIKGRSVIDVTLKKSSMELMEVVVTGFSQVRKKSSIGYATSSIKGKEITQAAPVNLQYGMAGKVSGLLVTSTTGGDNDFNTEDYDNITENRFLNAKDNPLSTFSIDVDAASYSNVRRMINENTMPPAGAVRVEEMINYFHYDYPQPANDDPFSVTTEISTCPWNKDHRLLMIGMQGKKIPVDNLPSSNLVFLIDVSGSMEMENKLPLVKSSLKLLTDQLRAQDKVSIVVYAGNAGLVLPSTNGNDKTKIKDAIDRLEAGGSTAGGAGIQLAYKTAEDQFIKGGNNRVILCTDGDFNVGVSSNDELERMIEKERTTGIFLTVLGYGMGNYKDSKMQKLADKGNGNHAYIDGINEAKKVLVNEFGGTLFTIAKDVKLQVEFNPTLVQGYRLVGYENRMLNKEDFNNDKKDAGEMGSGHTVTALYEIIPVGVETDLLEETDELKYQTQQEDFGCTKFSNEIMTVKFRYKAPSDSTSKLLVKAVFDKQVSLDKASANFHFASAVAAFGMLLRNSEFKSNANYKDVLKMAKASLGTDAEGYRAEFILLVEKARSLKSTAVNTIEAE